MIPTLIYSTVRNMDSCKVMPQIVVRALFGVILMLKKIVYCKNLLLVASEVLLISHLSHIPRRVSRGLPRLDGAWGKNKFGGPMFEPKVFGSKYTVLKKVLATLLVFFGAPNDSSPGALCLPCLPSLRPSVFPATKRTDVKKSICVISKQMQKISKEKMCLQ